MSLSPSIGSTPATPVVDRRRSRIRIKNGPWLFRGKTVKGSKAPWRIPQGSCRRNTFHFSFFSATAGRGRIVVWPGSAVNIVDQCGRIVPVFGRESNVSWGVGDTLFVQSVESTCLRRSVYVASHQALPFLGVSDGTRMITIGSSGTYHCLGCQETFLGHDEICGHLGIASARPSVLTKAGKWQLFTPRRKPEMFERYLHKIAQGKWDQTLLPQINPDDLRKRLQHLKVASANKSIKQLCQ